MKKIMITSDTHQDAYGIEKTVKFAKSQGIKTIFDCGDLHGNIESYSGINLHAVYWGGASGAMQRGAFANGIRKINGTMHENGSAFMFGDLAVYMQHNLAEYSPIIPKESTDYAKDSLDEVLKGNPDRKLILFGHTHSFHYLNDRGILALNPGSLAHTRKFIIFNPKDKSVEYRGVDKSILTLNPHSEYRRVRGLYENPLRFIAMFDSGKEAFVVDGERSKEYSLIREFCGSKGNSKMYAASLGKGRDILVLGGKESREFESVNTGVDPVIVNGVPCFVASKQLGKDRYEDSLIVGDRAIATFSEINSLEVKDGRLRINAYDGKKWSSVDVKLGGKK